MFCRTQTVGQSRETSSPQVTTGQLELCLRAQGLRLDRGVLNRWVIGMKWHEYNYGGGSQKHGGHSDANIDGHGDLQRWTRAADTLDQGTSYIPSLLDILRQIEEELLCFPSKILICNNWIFSKTVAPRRAGGVPPPTNSGQPWCHRQLDMMVSVLVVVV